MKPSLKIAAACGTLLSLCALSAHADINSALNAYGEQKYDAAYREFSQLSAQGDNRAKSFLALMTLRGLGTPRDVVQGARLARECAEGGEPTCAAIYGNLNLPGNGLPVNFAEARAWTRKAVAAGDQRAGFGLWQAYSLDPANQFMVKGKADDRKYNAIARRTVAERGDQIEAIDGLAGAAAAGYLPARLMLATLLLEQSGAGTTKQIRTLLDGIPNLPADYQKYLALAQQVDTLGPTRAAPKVVADAIPTVMTGAALASERAGTPNSTQCKDFRLMSIKEVSKVGDAVWLPLTQPLVTGTYPVKGTWTEDWHVFFCGAERTVQMQFSADGMGGAIYKVRS
ncbi:tetratricopeptide repeat protein [Herbaspirillum rhizosphaerae]|uniref:tetratricopeptide repeat protein n=1 Tax=Herbaspirillum rhizosphaerae TaxID=346179 RepID=UPI00067A88B0|nr:sel1 repeat family protein [Herbaspirillum rhizosphaerae]